IYQQGDYTEIVMRRSRENAPLAAHPPSLLGRSDRQSHLISPISQPDNSDICILRSRVFSADMIDKFLISPALVHLHHFRERVADGWSGRTEHPCTFGAAGTLKVRPFNPYHRAASGHYWT